MSGSPLEDLAAALRRLHRRAGEPSTHAIGKKIGYSHTTVGKALKCDRRPSWPVLKAIVNELCGDVDEFLDYWIAVRDHEDPLPPLELSLRAAETQDFAAAGHTKISSSGSQERVVLIWKDGTDSYEFYNETLALTWIENRLRMGEQR